MTPAPPFAPPALNPLQARFLNALCTRSLPASFNLHGAECTVTPDPWQADFAPACGLNLAMDGAFWRLEFASLAALELHPAGALAGDVSALPEDLRLALLELSLGPVLAALTDFLGQAGPPAAVAEQAAPQAAFACTIPLLLHLPGESVATKIQIPSREAAGAVLNRLQDLPLKRRPVDELHLPVSLEAGHARLAARDLRLLEIEDIILPDVYPALQGEVCLHTTPGRNIRCAVKDGLATVLDFAPTLPLEDDPMSDALPDVAAPETNHQEAAPQETPQETPGAVAPSEPLNLDSLEVTVSFELERRLMSVAEIAALTPGYTFPLAVDPVAPVTLRAGGQNIGSGRLVDLNGTLGVQVTAINIRK